MSLMNPTYAGSSILRTENFDCVCNTFDHSLRLQFDPTEEDIRCLEIWVDTAFPAEQSLWRRLRLAAKYIWSGRATDWTTGSFILRHEDYSRLRNFFLEYDLCVWKLKQKEGKNVVKQTDGVS